MDRCVCGYLKERHTGENLVCPGKTDNPDWSGNAENRFHTMDLPAGKTCSDCRHHAFCLQYLGAEISTNTQCDWYPIRFYPVEVKA